MNRLKNILRLWLPFAVVISAFCALAYAAVQQAYRQGANDPQIQMAEDAASALADGQAAADLIPASTVSVSKSLASFIIIYDADGKVAASSAQLDGKTPSLPDGVLDSTRQLGENRITWQPREGVRIASVIVSYPGGYVLAGRNMREVEARESQTSLFAGLTWVLALLATLLIIISLILLIGNDTPQVRAIRSYTVGFVGFMQDVLSLIPNVVELKQENEVLRRMNVNLSDEVSRLREARLENLRLREMLAMKDRGEFKLLPAEVIGKSLHLLRNTLTMSAGEVDGVTVDMPIISEQGLVGKVIAVSTRYSIGQLVINKDFRSSAKVQRSRVDGIVTWDGGDVLHLKNVAKKQDVQSGDLITTSDYSNVFPRDIKIGTVTGVSEPPGSLFKEIDVMPSVDFPSLEEVFIIMAVPDTERTALEHRTLHIK